MKKSQRQRVLGTAPQAFQALAHSNLVDAEESFLPMMMLMGLWGGSRGHNGKQDNSPGIGGMGFPAGPQGGPGSSLWGRGQGSSLWGSNSPWWMNFQGWGNSGGTANSSAGLPGNWGANGWNSAQNQGGFSVPRWPFFF